MTTELLLIKCHTAGGVHSEGTTVSSRAPMLFQNTISYCHHRALRAELWGPLFWLSGSLHLLSPMSCTVHLLSHQAQPIQTYHTNKNLQVSSPSKPLAPPNQSHLSVHSGQAAEQARSSTFQALTPLYGHQTAPVLASVVAVAGVEDRHATEHTDVQMLATDNIYCWATPFIGLQISHTYICNWLGS